MSLTQEPPPEEAPGPSPVALALEALATDLNDTLSRDPDGLFGILRSDARRIVLFKLLAKLPTDEVARLLAWMATHTPPPDAASLLLRAGMTPVGGRLAAAERRMVFERLLGATRMALLLDLCRSVDAGGTA